MPRRPTVPTWTTAVWNDLKNRTWHSTGGWEYPEGQVGYLVIDRDQWKMDYEPAPDPEPPNNAYPMAQDHWNRISAGELLGNNCIRKSGSDFQVEAWDEDMSARVNTCGGG